MFTLLLESPFVAGAMGVAGAVAAVAFCKITGSKKLGRLLAGVVTATLLMLIVERSVETDREEIESTLARMAADLERNDLQAVLEHIHSSVPEMRSRAEMMMPEFWIERVDIPLLREIRLEGEGTARKAVAEFNVTVTGRDREGAVESGRVPRFVILTLRSERDAWRVVEIEDHDPQQGYIRRTS